MKNKNGFNGIILFHLSKATKFNKNWGQEMKNRKVLHFFPLSLRSEERRVGKEC